MLLEDGKSIRFPHHEAARLAKFLAPGKNVAARGDGLSSPLATVIEAKEFGASLEDLHPIEHKGPKHAKHAKRSKHPKGPADEHAA